MLIVHDWTMAKASFDTLNLELNNAVIMETLSQGTVKNNSRIPSLLVRDDSKVIMTQELRVNSIKERKFFNETGLLKNFFMTIYW